MIRPFRGCSLANAEALYSFTRFGFAGARKPGNGKKGADCSSLLKQASFEARRFRAFRTALLQNRRRLLRLMSLNGCLFFSALPGLPAFYVADKRKVHTE